jgi:hypothetical protein
VALASSEWVMESSATLVIEVSISGSIWPVNRSSKPARPGETADEFIGSLHCVIQRIAVALPIN